MLESILKNPKRIIFIFSFIAIAGIMSGLNLPISLFPQTSKPIVRLNVNYAGLSAEDFIRKYGANFESQLEGIKNTGLKISYVKGEYQHTGALYTIEFDWNTSYEKSLKEVQNVVASFKGILPKESADSIGVWQWSSNAGFLALSFYSPDLDTNQLYKILDPILTPELKKVKDTENAMLWNPNSEEVIIKMDPDKLAPLGLFPQDVYQMIESKISGLSASPVKVGSDFRNFQIPTILKNIEDFSKITIKTPDQKFISLEQIATIEKKKSETREQYFKTDGKESLILFADPKSGANVKNMAEDILKVVKEKYHLYPKGVDYKILVDPSLFIKNSIQGLFKDVIIAGLLAVFVLFLFLGQLKNILTVAIEIPLSMVIAFSLMMIFDINLNLISLGGLALASGMNVDASIVVLENIFIHQDRWFKNHDRAPDLFERMQIIKTATSEVAMPIFLSILTTLIVFIPLILTSDLTYSILGDLSKAVVFSHSCSFFVSIILVPTIRMLIGVDVKETKAPLNSFFKKVENLYLKMLIKGFNFKSISKLALFLPFTLAGLLAFYIIPKLPMEIIGKPDTDWLVAGVYADRSESIRQVEHILLDMEERVKKIYPNDINYTFTQGNGKKNGHILFNLKDKKMIDEAIIRLQKEFINTPELNYWVESWNPAELPIPDVKHFDLKLKGSDSFALQEVGSKLRYWLKERGDYDRIQILPSIEKLDALTFVPHVDLWNQLEKANERVRLNDIAELSLYANAGKNVGSININQYLFPIRLQFSKQNLLDPDELAAYPIKLSNKIIPLSSLGNFKFEAKYNQILRMNSSQVLTLNGYLNKENETKWKDLEIKTLNDLKMAWPKMKGNHEIVLDIIPANSDLLKSLDQLKYSLLFSLILIFIVIWMDFQNIKETLVVMMSIPLGLIGVLLSLYIFKSTLSLNSALGFILLNGIAVNNSILLLSVFKDNKKKGYALRDAILSACQSRLRPILMTSLTTILGMLPIAFGLGDGGKILQPLGIAVAYGLMVSTSLTLFVIPFLLIHSKEEPTFREESRLSEFGVQPWQ
jgi:HAE1 family hydrophobic/amphiphilic exporter-1